MSFFIFVFYTRVLLVIVRRWWPMMLAAPLILPFLPHHKSLEVDSGMIAEINSCLKATYGPKKPNSDYWDQDQVHHCSSVVVAKRMKE